MQPGMQYLINEGFSVRGESVKSVKGRGGIIFPVEEKTMATRMYELVVRMYELK